MGFLVVAADESRFLAFYKAQLALKRPRRRFHSTSPSRIVIWSSKDPKVVAAAGSLPGGWLPVRLSEENQTRGSNDLSRLRRSAPDRRAALQVKTPPAKPVAGTTQQSRKTRSRSTDEGAGETTGGASASCPAALARRANMAGRSHKIKRPQTTGETGASYLAVRARRADVAGRSHRSRPETRRRRWSLPQIKTRDTQDVSGRP